MNRILKYFMILFVTAHICVPVIMSFFMSGPIYINDYALMIYFEHRAVQFFSIFHSFWGYDPTYMAGYPLDFTWNSNLGLQVLAVLLRPIPETTVLLLSTVASIIIAPPLFWAGLSNFGLRGSARNAAMILLLAYWWSSYIAVLMLIGMPTSLFAFHLSFYTVSLFYRFFRGDPGATWKLYVFLPICFIAHKTSLILVGLPAAILFFCYLKNLNSRRIAHLAGICAITIAVNSFWVFPFLQLVKYKITIPDAPHGLSFDPLRIFKDFFTLSKIMGHRPTYPDKNNFLMLLTNTVMKDALLFFGILGMSVWRRAGKKTEAVFFSIMTVLFLAEIYYGSFWNATAQFYPTRYIGYLDLMLAIPAAIGLQEAWRRLSKIKEFKKTIPLVSSTVLLVLFLSSLLIFGVFFRQLDTRLDSDTIQLTSFLKDHTPGSGRIMLEDSGWNDRDAILHGTPPKYGKSHFPSLMADITGHEFIGGPYPYVFSIYHYADFHDGKFLKKPLADFTPPEMKQSLDWYYIRWIVCWSADCKKYFSASSSQYKNLKNIGKFDVFERTAFDPNPFIIGSGVIKTDIAGIRCSSVKPENGRVVLKYHAFDKLIIEEGKGNIGAAKFGNDPMGFIEVKDPSPYFKIVNGYGRKAPK